jgi:2-keto-4-pentenoate hydratase/2-oxohepta-3-ene-1,7-dioic acid hydratase in catechol pathway
MRLARYLGPDGVNAIGALANESIVPLVLKPDDADAQIVELAMSPDRANPVGPPLPLHDVRLLAPIGRPSTVRDFLTFETHYRTTLGRVGQGVPAEWYKTPGFYFSNPNTIVGNDDVVVPPVSDEVDYELEVAVVIGRDCSDVTPDEAVGVIAGYTIFNDFSARDIQRREMTIGMGAFKSKDFANAFGPVIATPDELRGVPGRPSASMTAAVNGEVYSRDDLSNMHYSFAEMISFASRDSLLRAGDLLGSGTCATGCLFELTGTHGVQAYPWLAPGDVVVLEVEGIGTLRNIIGEGEVN